jgi:hypothetical protein
MAFSCKEGKVLTNEEVRDMLRYDNAGLARPDEYDDVVFDSTSVRGAVYRCQTAEEKNELEAQHAATLKAAQDEEKAIADLRAKVLGEAAMAGAGVRAVVNDAGTATGVADTDTEPARSGTRRS